MDCHFSDELDNKLWFGPPKSFIIEDLIQSIPFMAGTEMPPKKKARF
jgi:hypothetical protein